MDLFCIYIKIPAIFSDNRDNQIILTNDNRTVRLNNLVNIDPHFLYRTFNMAEGSWMNRHSPKRQLTKIVKQTILTIHFLEKLPAFSKKTWQLKNKEIG